MDRADLEMVMAVHRNAHLARAAQALGVTPSAVTRRLATLESRLGVRLFQRSTRRVTATAEGEALVERAADLLQGFASLESDLRERQADARGPIRLASTFGFGRAWVGPAVAAFQAMHPAITVQLQLTERLPDLAVEGYDAAVWLWNAPERRAGEWVSRQLAPNRRVLVASSDYLTVHGEPLEPADLAMHHCLLVRENTGPGNAPQDQWLLQRDGDDEIRRVSVAGPLSSNSGELVRDWCLAGHGVMLRSLWDVGHALKDGRLVQVLPAWSHRDADIHWIAPWRPTTPRRLNLLLQHLGKVLGSQPWRNPRTRPARG